MSTYINALMIGSLALMSSHLVGQDSPISIKLRVLEADTAAKSVEITLTNTSGHEVSFPCSDVSMIKINVYNPDGSLAADTTEGAELKKEQRTPRSGKSVCVSTGLASGQLVKHVVDVSSLYKMSSPGTYHVQAELDVSDGSTAKSKQVDVVIK